MTRSRTTAALPSSLTARLHEAVALHKAAKFDEAETRYRALLKDHPQSFDCLHLLGVVIHQRGEHQEALRWIDAALAVNPDAAIAYNSRAAALNELKRFKDALASSDRAIALRPAYAEAFNNRAVALHALKRFEEARASCDEAIALNASFAEAYYNRGNALSATKRHAEALAEYDRALSLRPDYPEALSCRGAMLKELNRLTQALSSYDRAFALNPDLNGLRGDRLSVKMSLCAWSGLAEDWAGIDAALAGGRAAAAPFQLLPTPLDAAAQLASARRIIADEFPPCPQPLWRGERYRHDRIRIAYVSRDFRDHAVAYLAAGLFEQHDRSQFEIYGIGFGLDDHSEMRARLKRGFDHFVDVHMRSDHDVARLLRELEIDIVVDLMGLTGSSRLGIFAQRPSPIQVSYLGYAGTTGADYIDYVIADRFILPHDLRPNFAEKVVWLPECFQVNDATREIAARTPSRRSAGLAEAAFVFCCFCGVGKITPDVFDVWMRLLRAIEGSVLWLAAAHEGVRENLAREAAKRGVSPDRLIFAPKLNRQEDHLARHRLADLFLDTLYFNAHTTAADALWAGLPVVTCAGATYASRVAGSLLHAVGLPELVTASLDDYEALALSLARDRDKLALIRHRLATNRETFPLFDTVRFTRHLELVYRSMWARYQRGEAPRSFGVPALPPCSPSVAEQNARSRKQPGSNAEASATPRNTLDVRLANGTTLALSPSLEDMTTYVLLEQETWFEKELEFLPHVLKPGMTAIDIGANVGVYSLAMARLVAPGAACSYEPRGAARSLLERSRDLNHASNLEIFPFALSDTEQDGFRAFGGSRNAAGQSEQIVTTLAAEAARRQWPAPDFIKIDAEGEEDRILLGGRELLSRFSPLVMFKIKAGDEVNRSAQALLQSLGYGLYRLLSGLPLLVPIARAEEIDRCEPNVFAAKPDRAAMLEASGVLAAGKGDWYPDAAHKALPRLTAQQFAPAFKPSWGGDIDADYRDALVAYEVWRSPEIALPQRWAALDDALAKMCSLCERAANFARLSSLARIASEAGRRSICSRALGDFISAMESRQVQILEPFWPACPRYDAIAPGAQPGLWFAASAIEQYERTRADSTYFADDASLLDWLCQQPHASIEMERRRVLMEARKKGTIEVPSRLLAAAPDHINAEAWRKGIA